MASIRLLELDGSKVNAGWSIRSPTFTASSSDFVAVCTAGDAEGGYVTYEYAPGTPSGEVTVDMSGYAATTETYVLRYYDANSKTMAESAPFHFRGASAQQQQNKGTVRLVSIDATSSAVKVAWRMAGSTTTSDFVALCKHGSIGDDYLTYSYASGNIAGEATIDASGGVVDAATKATRQYVVAYFSADSKRLAESTPFTWAAATTTINVAAPAPAASAAAAAGAGAPPPIAQVVSVSVSDPIPIVVAAVDSPAHASPAAPSLAPMPAPSAPPAPVAPAVAPLPSAPPAPASVQVGRPAPVPSRPAIDYVVFGNDLAKFFASRGASPMIRQVRPMVQQLRHRGAAQVIGLVAQLEKRFGPGARLQIPTIDVGKLEATVTAVFRAKAPGMVPKVTDMVQTVIQDAGLDALQAILAQKVRVRLDVQQFRSYQDASIFASSSSSSAQPHPHQKEVRQAKALLVAGLGTHADGQGASSSPPSSSGSSSSSSSSSVWVYACDHTLGFGNPNGEYKPKGQGASKEQVLVNFTRGEFHDEYILKRAGQAGSIACGPWELCYRGRPLFRHAASANKPHPFPCPVDNAGWDAAPGSVVRNSTRRIMVPSFGNTLDEARSQPRHMVQTMWKPTPSVVRRTKTTTTTVTGHWSARRTAPVAARKTTSKPKPSRAKAKTRSTGSSSSSSSSSRRGGSSSSSRGGGGGRSSKKKDIAKKLHGKIKLVKSFEDYKVKIVTSFADLHVKKVTSCENRVGRWKIVTSCEDFKVKIVSSFEDIKVKYVTSFEGVKC